MAAVYTGLPMALQTPRQPALHVRLYPPHGQRADPYLAREPTSGFELRPLAREDEPALLVRVIREAVGDYVPSVTFSCRYPGNGGIHRDGFTGRPQ